MGRRLVEVFIPERSECNNSGVAKVGGTAGDVRIAVLFCISLSISAWLKFERGHGSRLSHP